MEELQQSLESLLHLRFRIVPTHTNRQDQWYKRSYEGWKSDDKNFEPLILAPKDSREDWAPELRKSAAIFARALELAVDKERKYQDTLRNPPDAKLFDITIVDQDRTSSGWVASEADSDSKLRLLVSMERTSYWNQPYYMDAGRKFKPDVAVPRSYLIKALLKAEQIKPLLYLAKHPQAGMKDLAFAESKGWYRQQLDVGWASILDETLQAFLFLVIFQCFPEALALEDGLQKWLPFALVPSPLQSTMCLYSRPGRLNHGPNHHGSKGALGEKEIQDDVRRCFRVLTKACVLYQACSLAPVDWEQRMIDGFLYFVGFEAWNRAREGESYLGCNLNKSRDEKWLRQWAGDKGNSDEAPDVPPLPSKRSKDPLFMHEPKQKPAREPDEEEAELLDDLASLELQEALYGRKRSTKYQRNTS